jgi:hypothetical protein
MLATMERRIASLRAAGGEVEYRRYKNVGHGGSGPEEKLLSLPLAFSSTDR